MSIDEEDEKLSLFIQERNFCEFERGDYTENEGV